MSSHAQSGTYRSELDVQVVCGWVIHVTYRALKVSASYALHRAVHFRPLGHSGRTLANVLNKVDNLRPLFDYINATGRFRSIYGSLDNALPDDGDAT